MNEMTNDAAVAWRIRIGDSHTWGFTSDEDDADFHGKNSGLPYVKEALVPATTVAELRAEVDAWQSQCEGLNESRRDEMARADAAERRVADLLQAVREVQIAESDVRIHEAMNPRSRNYRLPIYEVQRQARERLSALTKESP